MSNTLCINVVSCVLNITGSSESHDGLISCYNHTLNYPCIYSGPKDLSLTPKKCTPTPRSIHEGTGIRLNEPRPCPQVPRSEVIDNANIRAELSGPGNCAFVEESRKSSREVCLELFQQVEKQASNDTDKDMHINANKSCILSIYIYI